MSASLFQEIARSLLEQHPDVIEGKMMSSPGLKCNNKVFAFHHKDQMGFRLGPSFDPVTFGLTTAAPLSPFKTKPPLKGWFMVTSDERFRWAELSALALEFTRSL